MSLHLLYLNTEADAAGVVPGVRAVAMTKTEVPKLARTDAEYNHSYLIAILRLGFTGKEY